jgi:solute carrier family 50 (sugar transporter)
MVALLSKFVRASLVGVVATSTCAIQGGAIGSSSSTNAIIIPTTNWIVETCSQLAPITSMILFAAPVPTIIQIISSKSVGSLPLLPYSSMIANAILWTTYGILRKESSIYTCNGIGAVLAILYLLQFIRYSPSKSSTLPGSVLQHVSVITLVAIGAIVLALQTYIKNPADIIGSIAVLFCIAMFASPLSALKTVIQTKSASSIPLPLAIASIANCLLWLVTGVYKMKDFNVIVPNFMGLASGIAQIALKLKYGNTPPKTYELGL